MKIRPFSRRSEKRELPEFLNVPWSIKDLIIFVVAWFGLQIIIILIVGFLSPVVPFLRDFLLSAQNGDVGATLILDLLDAATGFAVVWLYLRRYKVGWSAVGWRRVNVLRAVGYLIAIMFIFVIGVNLLLWLVTVFVPGFNANQAQDSQLIGQAKTHPNTALIGLVLLPPVLEETIFRGFLFPALAKKWGVVMGAVISSVIFGIAHWQANISVYTFLLGLLLCFMYLRLKSIFPGMAVHMLNNYLAFIALSGK